MVTDTALFTGILFSLDSKLPIRVLPDFYSNQKFGFFVLVSWFVAIDAI